MKINLKKNEEENRIKSILFIALVIEDIITIEKLLHPKGKFLGMPKSRFVYLIMESIRLEKEEMQRNNKDEEMMKESEYPFRFDETISMDKLPGERCFTFRYSKINNGEPIKCVFKIHEQNKNMIGEIIVTNAYEYERHLKSNLFFSSDYHHLCVN